MLRKLPSQEHLIDRERVSKICDMGFNPMVFHN